MSLLVDSDTKMTKECPLLAVRFPRIQLFTLLFTFSSVALGFGWTVKDTYGTYDYTICMGKDIRPTRVDMSFPLWSSCITTFPVSATWLVTVTWASWVHVLSSVLYNRLCRAPTSFLPSRAVKLIVSGPSKEDDNTFSDEKRNICASNRDGVKAGAQPKFLIRFPEILRAIRSSAAAGVTLPMFATLVVALILVEIVYGLLGLSIIPYVGDLRFTHGHFTTVFGFAALLNKIVIFFGMRRMRNYEMTTLTTEKEQDFSHKLKRRFLLVGCSIFPIAYSAHLGNYCTWMGVYGFTILEYILIIFNMILHYLSALDFSNIYFIVSTRSNV